MIVMKHIVGTPLSTLLRSVRLEPQEAVQFILQIARAVHYAHQRGIIHRDLKPSNILIDEANHPFVTDFGLSVNLFDSSTEVPCAGGTPQYMSPEQVTATSRIDARSDVWSLGVILAEMIHGERPFPNKERKELFQSILNDEPSISSIPQTTELDAIVRRCLKKQPSDRTASCEELARDLSLWLRRNFPGGISKWWYGWRRNTLIAFALTISIGGSLASWQMIRIDKVRTTLAQLETSPVDQIALNIDRLRASGATIKSVLSRPEPTSTSGKLRIALALIALGDRSSESASSLVESLMSAEPEVIAETLKELRKAQKVDWFCNYALKSVKEKGDLPVPSLTIGAVVAGSNSNHGEWKSLEPQIVDQILKLPESDLVGWLGLLAPIGKPRLAELFQQVINKSVEGSQERLQSIRVMAILFEADTNALTNMVQAANPNELHVLLPYLEDQKPAMTTVMANRFNLIIQGVRQIRIEEDQKPTIDELGLTSLAISLFMLGDADCLLEAIQHGDNPTLQSLVIHGLGQLKIAPKFILELLQQQHTIADSRSTAIRFGLLQALSLMDTKSFASGVDWSIVEDLWMSDSDCGVHSSARLATVRIGKQLKPLTVGEYGNWRVDKIGSGTQDFVVIDPCEYEMGMSDKRNVKLLLLPWPKHLRVFPRQIAIATTEVTMRQFLDLLPDFPMTQYMAEDYDQESAMVIKSLDNAYQFCNLLSEAAGYETCYQLIDQGTETRWEPKNNHLELTGYRLPTDGEWELACRAGTMTGRYFGNAHQLVASYGWLKENSNQAERRKSNAFLTQRVANFLPNRFGLFDLYGNAKELCDMSISPNNTETVCVDKIVPHDQSFRRKAPLLRGCSYLENGMAYAKSHSRTSQIVISTDPTVGFRLARTIRNVKTSDLDVRDR
jgi:serine/threonine protein kinase/formylglycine-generating enzyme required for sulfatase activity